MSELERAYSIGSRLPVHDGYANELFKGPDGECNDSARAAIRLGFHDARPSDKNSPNGGADGSLLMDFGAEIDQRIMACRMFASCSIVWTWGGSC